MSFLDRLLGRFPQPARPARPASDPDAVAVERYRYLLRTAPPDQLEQAHVEAFERLTPQQRAMVRDELAAVAPGEAPTGDDPRALARSATRAELREPGTLERTWQRQPGGMPGMAGGFLQTFAAVFVATTAAQMLFGSFGYGDGGADAGAEGDAGSDTGADGGPDAGDAGGWDGGGFGDGGGFADFGGDF